MKAINYTISKILLSSLLCLVSYSSFAGSAPGAEDRCARARDECAERASNVGHTEQCNRAYRNCISRASGSGSAYQKCRAEGGSVESCRGEYQKGMGNE